MPEPESRRWVQQIFGKGLVPRVIAPASPGFDLARAIDRELTERPGTSGGKMPSLWILQNHGLAWAGSSEKTILAAALTLETKLRDRFHLTEYPAPSPTPVDRTEKSDGRRWYRLRFDHWPQAYWGKTGLFPDFIGHFSTGKSGNLLWINDREVRLAAATRKEAQSHAEVFFAHALLSTIAHQHGWLRPLPPACIRLIRTYVLEGNKSLVRHTQY